MSKSKRGARDRQQQETAESESDGTASSGSQECLPKMKKMMHMNTPLRKGNMYSKNVATPGSTSTRKFSRNPQTPRSALRPGTAGSELRPIPVPIALREADPVEVYCRVKPLGSAPSGCVKIIDDNTVALVPPDNSSVWRQGMAKESHYTFQRVFDENVSQKEVFDTVALPLLKDFVEGKNALLFAYGVTGSGKTYTMSGNGGDCGIMPRCLDVVFNSIAKYKATKFVFKPDRMNGFDTQTKAEAMNERQKELLEKTREAGRTPRSRVRSQAQEMDLFSCRIREDKVIPVKTTDSLYSVFVTYIEVYNNYVYDLLDESPLDFGAGKKLPSKMLREDMTHNVYVNGVTEIEVESPGDAFEVYQKGLKRRRMSHTVLNTESSRSHSIFNIRLVRAPTDSEGEELVERKEDIIVSQLSLVDLAGSERYGRTQATGDRLKEAGNINNSLMNLRKCMDILRENQQFCSNRVIPYRDSKLTHFLKNYFEGEGRVRMILCVNPKNEDFDENVHVFSFADLTQEVQIYRPQEKKVVELQTPGRVKANEMYKEAKRQLVEEKRVEEADLPETDTQFVFGMGFPIPICNMTRSDERELLETLKQALEIRVKGLDDVKRFVSRKRDELRHRISGLEQEVQTLRYENQNYRIQIEQLQSEKKKQDNVIREMVVEKNDLEARCEEQEHHLKEMEDEVVNLRMQFRQRDMQHFKEKQALKSDLDLKRELEDLKRARHLHKEEEKLKAQFKQKDDTLAAVAKLVSSVDIPQTRSRTRRSRGSFGLLEDSLSTTSSEPDLLSVGKSGKSHNSRARAPSAPLLPIENTPGTGITAQTKRATGIPVNRRPRARSTDKDVWVEHTAGIALKSGTVFQPCMKKKKSLTKLSRAEDIPTNASKYCLRTQEQDSEGEVETKLYKGDVLSTVGGGTQVVFNDVEVLRQESPTATAYSPRKRLSSGTAALLSPFLNRSSHYGENPEGISERCKTAISHTSAKRSRQT